MERGEGGGQVDRSDLRQNIPPDNVQRKGKGKPKQHDIYLAFLLFTYILLLLPPFVIRHLIYMTDLHYQHDERRSVYGEGGGRFCVERGVYAHDECRVDSVEVITHQKSNSFSRIS